MSCRATNIRVKVIGRYPDQNVTVHIPIHALISSFSGSQLLDANIQQIVQRPYDLHARLVLDTAIERAFRFDDVVEHLIDGGDVICREIGVVFRQTGHLGRDQFHVVCNRSVQNCRMMYV